MRSSNIKMTKIDIWNEGRNGYETLTLLGVTKYRYLTLGRKPLELLKKPKKLKHVTRENRNCFIGNVDEMYYHR